MQNLLRAIRESCSPGTWSRGVELARSGAVVGESDDGDEIVLRVSTRGGLVSPQVVLFPNDEDWTCECKSKELACAHVAASAIALRQARQEGKQLPGVDDNHAPGHIAYRLDGRSGRLELTRVIVTADGETRLDGSLAQIALGKSKGPKFVASEADLAFEKKLGTFGGGVISRQQMGTVLDALRSTTELTYNGEPATIGPKTSGLAARVSEAKENFLLRLEQDREIDTIYENGAVRRGKTISPVGSHGLPERLFTELRKGKQFRADQVANLVGDVLPKLRRHMPVVIDTAHLPGSKTVKPRIQIATERKADSLVLLPTIAYGDPPVARVDGDKLTMLGKGEVPLRNIRLEKLLADRLSTLGLEAGSKAKLSPAKAIAVTQQIAQEKDVRITGSAHQDFFAAGALTPRLEVGEDGQFSVWFESAGDQPGDSKTKGKDGMRVDASAVVRAWSEGHDYAPLLEGGFGQIPAQWLAEHGHRVAGLLAAREAMREDKASGVAGWAYADLAALCEALDQPPPPGFDRLRTLVHDFEGIPKPELPEDLKAELRDYQFQGVAWLSFLRNAELGALLADDMGLGKTLQALCAVKGRSLVVAPTSVMSNWANEIAAFRPGLTTSIYHGTGRKLDPNADVTLTTYALLRLDIEQLKAVQWGTIILDESQAIKNPESQVARSAYRLAGDFRVALTGTPVENRLDDLWSQFHFINRGLLGGRSDFNDRFVRPIAAGDEHAANALRERIRPFVLRRLKGEVAAELPPRTDVALHCDLNPEERKVYDAVRASTLESVVEKMGAGAGVMAVLEALLRLRQAACHPALVPGQSRLRDNSSSKISLLLETLDEAIAEGHKALVFSQWTSLLDLVEPHLKSAKHDYVRLDGATRDRGKVVDRFQDDSGPPVMLISLRAGGTGLNLTAADHVFLLDPWWNPAVEDQAADRAHRIGQDKPVIVHRLVARNTVEERILALQTRKRQLAETAVGDAAGATQITRDELLALLD